MEHLRPALRVLFKDMSVWTTRAAAMAHEATTQQAIEHADLYYASLDATAPTTWVRPQISHWRFRSGFECDTAEKLKAAILSCRSSLEAVQARRQERELMFSYTSDDSNDSWCISYGSVPLRCTGEHNGSQQ
jgi:hypothetical protein